MGWVAAGLSADVGAGMSIPGRCGETDIALWRSVSGVLHAWNDRCPHRGMRLSHGFVRGETLACIYHGWRYGTTGACNHIPAHPTLTPPKSVTATVYSCTESDGIIWVTSKETEKPAPTLKGTEPLRSLNVQATPAQIAAHLDCAPAQILHHRDVTLVLQEYDADHTYIHALCRSGTDKKTASRDLETLRRAAERSVQ